MNCVWLGVCWELECRETKGNHSIISAPILRFMITLRHNTSPTMIIVRYGIFSETRE